MYLDTSLVDAEFIKKEEEILTAKQKEAGKPDHLIPNIVKGQIAKYLKEICLLSQPFVKNPDITVEQLLAEKKAKVVQYARYQVGEGIEKKQGKLCGRSDETDQEVICHLQNAMSIVAKLKRF